MPSFKTKTNMAFSFLMSLTEDEFKAYLKTSIKEALQENQPAVSSIGNAEDFLTVKQASEFTHIPVATLYDYTHKQRIPFNKVGKKLLFSRKDLVSWIADHRRRTTKELTDLSLSDMIKSRKHW